jgi:hypothetical protein
VNEKSFFLREGYFEPEAHQHRLVGVGLGMKYQI